MDFLSFDQLLSLPTAIECITTLCLFLFFPKFTFFILFLMIALYLYLFRFRLNKPTKVKTSKMNSAIYLPTKSTNFLKVKSINIPSYADNEVLIAVKYASINPVDYKVNTSLFPFARYFIPLSIGRDVVGTVIEIGKSVTKFSVGDVVYGCAESGSLAEYAVCMENKVSIVPSGINPIEIAGCALATETAYQSLLWFYKKEDFQDLTVLIIGGSGGVGSSAIQLCKAFNVKKVYGTCSTKNVDFLRTFTPDIIDYTKDINKQIGAVKFDLIFDTVTSMDDPNQYLIYSRYLSNKGKYVQINGTPGEFFGGIMATRVARISMLEKKNFHLHLLEWKREELEDIAKIMRENKLKIRYEKMDFTYDDILGGFNKLKSRRTVGKIVYDINTTDSTTY